MSPSHLGICLSAISAIAGWAQEPQAVAGIAYRKEIPAMRLSSVPDAFPSPPQSSGAFVMPTFDMGTYKGFGETLIIEGETSRLDPEETSSGTCKITVSKEGITFERDLYPWRFPTQYTQAAEIENGNYRKSFGVLGQSGPIWVVLLVIYDDQGNPSRAVRMFLVKES